MKKLVAKHKLTQKIFLSIIIVLLLSFAVPVKSHAGIGGLLLDPLFDLVGTVADVICGALQAFLVDGEFRNTEDSSGLNFYLANKDDFKQTVNGTPGPNATAEEIEKYNKYSEFKYDENSDVKEEIYANELDKNLWGSSTYAIPMMRYTPEKIFSGRIPALDINFVNPTDWTEVDENGDKKPDYDEATGTAMNDRSIARELHKTIAEWYVSLRNLTVVGLMLVLVYVGIRMVISSAASDKAKYKQMLMDWLVALCIVFCLHYIMTFTTAIVNEISQAISGGIENNGNNIGVTVYQSSSAVTTQTGSNYANGGSNNSATATEDVCSKCGERIHQATSGAIAGQWVHSDNSFANNACTKTPNAESGETTENTGSTAATGTTTSGNVDVQFNTDLMGLIRFKMQYNTVGSKLLYLIFYIAMVVYTCMFTFYYLKRVLTMAFLTLISPVVALTYPIDKIRDGKAQAFNMWLKEYIFNALLQPFHLIIYSIFVGSAVELAAKNPLYAIVALAFITPAEKILRKFFGFDKASTAGALGAVASVAGGAALMNSAKNLMSPKKGGGGKSGSGARTNVEDKKPSPGEAFGGNGEALEGDSSDSRTQIRESEQPQEAQSGENNSLPAGSSNYEMSQNNNGAYIPTSSEALTRSSTPTSPRETESPVTIRSDDDRGFGQYALDVGKHIGGKALGAAQGFASGAANRVKSAGGALGSKIGKIPLGSKRTIGGVAKSIAQKDGVKKFSKLAGNSVRHMANAAKGVGNVALKTGMAAGKAALKAAPGAVLGMAAGIAGDELGDIWKYTTAGAALSSTIGSSAVAQAGSFISSAYNEGAHGSVEGQIEQRKKEFQKDKSNTLLAQSMNPDASKEEIKEIVKKASYYDSIGIEGKNAFKAVTIENELKKKMTAEQGMSETDASKMAQKQAAVIAEQAQKYDTKDEKKVKSLRNNLSHELEKGGLKGKEKMDTIEMIVSNVKRIQGVSNDY